LADPFLKKHKNGALVVTGALVLVIAFWIYQAPHTHFYRMYRLKQKLRNLSLPPQTTVPTINDDTVELPYGLVIDGVIGFYSTNVDCGVVIAHYKAEFARQGFSYANEDEGKSAALRFSSSEFSGKLICSLHLPQKQSDPILQKLPTIYLITMNWTEVRR
jgi:hypothetical protein